MHRSSSNGLRKGAWTEEEDQLLRNCIHKYGEGKWHQVPHRAGLNRCRKSCRLRWLNYLRPNIKRGNFGLDEVDLIIRLHKLLGNRWSLIAGRLPGRTANDVKNYWNTHMKKKEVIVNGTREGTREAAAGCSSCRKTTTEAQKTTTATTIIKPRPRSFSKNSPWLRHMITSTADVPSSSSTTGRVIDHVIQIYPPDAAATTLINVSDEVFPKLPMPLASSSPSSQLQADHHDMLWLENLFNDEDITGACNHLTDFRDDRISNLWSEETWCGFGTDGRNVNLTRDK